jgi:hypothetical protein
MSMSRRHLLAGAGGLLVLAACGGDSKPFIVAGRYPSNTFVPGKIRLPISLADKDRLLTSGPSKLTGRVLDSSNKLIANVTAGIRSKDMVIPYWPFVVDIATPGVYTLRINGDDGNGTDFLVSDPADVTVPYVGSKLAPFDTPTVDNHRGVEPYCTLTPNPCPLHAVTLTQALSSGTPVGYMIGTPAHCQTGVCAPALEFLVKSHARIGDKITMVHADVYSDPAGTTVAPAVAALGLDYEPVLYLCAPDATVRDRIDVMWDQSELDERLDAFLAAVS